MARVVLIRRLEILGSTKAPPTTTRGQNATHSKSASGWPKRHVSTAFLREKNHSTAFCGRKTIRLHFAGEKHLDAFCGRKTTRPHLAGGIMRHSSAIYGGSTHPECPKQSGGKKFSFAHLPSSMPPVGRCPGRHP